ncbi:MAG: ArnT family glycosyltransferase [Planctomycetota bacterium]|jgi:4-amino-4-deoxy-L-arabinose transferase-like glycosyltransferase
MVLLDNFLRLDNNRVPFPDESKDTSACLVILTVVCAALFLLNLSSLPLANSEEAREALVAQDMLQTGQWLMPTLEGAPFDKPPLFFWMAAAGRYILGDIELPGRLISAVSGFLAVIITFAFGRRIKGNLTGLLAGLILATSPEFFFLARWYRMEMLFTLMMWAAMWWFWRYEIRSGKTKTERIFKWMGFYAFCAVATLIKGPAGLALPVMIVGVYFLLCRNWRGIIEFFSVTGITLYLLIIAGWYVPVVIRYPQWSYEFFILHNFSRYAGKGFGHHGLYGAGPFTFIPFLLGGLLPWTCFLPMTIERSFPRVWSKKPLNSDSLLLWSAAVVPFVFFSFSGIKLSSYILPVFPPLTVLVACFITEWMSLDAADKLYHRGSLTMYIILSGMLLAVTGIERYMGWLDGFIILLFVPVLFCFAMMKRALRRTNFKVFVGFVLIAAVYILLFAILHTAPVAFEYMSCRQFGLAVRKRIAPDTILCYLQRQQYSFPLYAGRTSAVLIDKNEPADFEKLADLMNSEKTVYCIVNIVKDLEALETFKQTYKGRLNIVLENRKFLMFSNTEKKENM